MNPRNLREDDHPAILSVVDEWFGGRKMAHLAHRFLFEHFADTSYAVEDGGELRGFLVGFVSQAREGEAYIHLVAVHPRERGKGAARALYERFFSEVRKRGAKRVGCVTSPQNTASIGFHGRMGFRVVPGDGRVDGVEVHKEHGGPGRDLVVMEKTIG